MESSGGAELTALTSVVVDALDYARIGNIEGNPFPQLGSLRRPHLLDRAAYLMHLARLESALPAPGGSHAFRAVMDGSTSVRYRAGAAVGDLGAGAWRVGFSLVSPLQAQDGRDGSDDPVFEV